MRTNSFVAFSHKYATAMAGRNVPVTFGGTEAWTDNRIINLPALPPGTMMTPWETKVLTGYLDHEVGHLRWTNWKEHRLKRPGPTEPNYTKELLTYHLYNVFEDVRMENDVITDSPPIKPYLDAVEQQMQYTKREKGDEEEQRPLGAEVLEAIYHEAYAQYRHPEITWEPGPRLNQFPQLKPIRDAMKALGTMRSTGEAADLAEKVYRLLPKDLDYGAPPPTELRLILGGGPGQEQITITIPTAALVPQHGTPNIPIEVIEAAIEQSHKPEALKILLAEIKEANTPKAHTTPIEQQRWGDHVLPPLDTSQDNIFVPTTKNRTQLERTRATATAEITAAKKMLTIALRARTKKAWEKGLPEGRLDDEALHGLFAGNTNLFKERRTTQAVDTAVQVMVDLSGSMPAQETALAAIILAEALATIRGIKLSIAGFTTGKYVHHQGKIEGAGRCVALEIPLFKDFDEQYQSARERLGALHTGGSTPLGDAYALGMERLIPRKEPRKVLWIITDGDPSIAVADPAHSEFMLMEKTYRHCQELAIKVVLLNIGRMNSKTAKLADIALAVSSHTALPGALITITRGLSL